MSLTPNPETIDRFEALAGKVGARGRGLSLAQLRDCHALARELESSEPDPERVGFLSRRLDLDPETLEHEPLPKEQISE